MSRRKRPLEQVNIKDDVFLLEIPGQGVQTWNAKEAKAKKIGKYYNCPSNHCFYKTTALKDFKCHIIRRHISDDKKPFQCKEPLCGKGFATAGDLQCHLETPHHYLLKRQKAQNQSTETKETLEHVCPHCPKKFRFRSRVRDHILRVHVSYEERPFLCQVDGNNCKVRFGTNHGLQKHIRNKHPNALKQLAPAPSAKHPSPPLESVSPASVINPDLQPDLDLETEVIKPHHRNSEENLVDDQEKANVPTPTNQSVDFGTETDKWWELSDGAQVELVGGLVPHPSFGFIFYDFEMYDYDLDFDDDDLESKEEKRRTSESSGDASQSETGAMDPSNEDVDLMEVDLNLDLDADLLALGKELETESKMLGKWDGKQE